MKKKKIKFLPRAKWYRVLFSPLSWIMDHGYVLDANHGYQMAIMNACMNPTRYAREIALVAAEKRFAEELAYYIKRYC